MFDPQQALLDLLQPGSTFQTLFPPTSRYYGIPAATFIDQDGLIQIYLQRRFLPPLESFTALQQHTVSQNERLDHIAFRYLGNPEQFWRIADANTAMNADDLTRTAGRLIRIPFAGSL
jgi:hypothetical protein